MCTAPSLMLCSMLMYSFILSNALLLAVLCTSSSVIHGSMLPCALFPPLSTVPYSLPCALFQTPSLMHCSMLSNALLLAVLCTSPPLYTVPCSLVHCSLPYPLFHTPFLVHCFKLPPLCTVPCFLMYCSMLLSALFHAPECTVPCSFVHHFLPYALFHAPECTVPCS